MASTFELLLLAQVQNLLSTTPQLLGSTILTGTAPSISISIPSGYNHLQGYFSLRQDSGSGGAFATMQLNGDSSSHYTWETLFGQQAVTTSANSAGTANFMRLAVIPGSADTANYFATGTFNIGNCSSAFCKSMSSQFQGPLSPTNGVSGTAGGTWTQTSVVSSVTVLPNSGNLVAGSSLSIYGLK